MTLEEAIRSNEDLELSYRDRMHHLPSEEANGGRKDDDFCSCGRRSERRTDADD